MPAENAAEGTVPTLEVGVERLASLVTRTLVAAGLDRASAQAVAAPLVDADRAGLASHGVMLVPMYVERLRAGSISPLREASVVSDRGTAVVLDGAHAFGQLTAQQAIDLARTRAREHGIAVVAVRHAFHFGAAGYWAAQLARDGLIGMAMSNTRPLMPAPDGSERIVGNNPLAIAVPATGEPIVFDMAASATAMGKIRLAARAGVPIPAGWATDAYGQPTTDATAALRGMLQPAGGAKGFGLALVIDLLCGGLSGGAMGDAVQALYGDPRKPYDCAHCFIAIDVARLADPTAFAAAVAVYRQRLRSSRVVTGAAPVRVPGDRPAAERRKSVTRCTISRDTANALDALAASLGLSERLVG